MEKRERSSKWIIFFFIPFLIWIILQFIAPVLLPSSSIGNLSGNVGFSDNKIIIEKLPAPLGVIYGAGDRLCHQREDRSLFINGNQMPFCTRCTAIFLGFAVGLGLMIFYKIKLNEKFLLLILIGIIPIGFDGIGQQLNFWESTNIIRFITGMLAGTVCGISIAIIIDEVVSLNILNRILKKQIK
jgi:uncharacterized membrane protein